MAVVLALALAATDLQLGSSDANTVAKSGEAKEGLDRARGLRNRRGSCCRTRSWSMRHQPRGGRAATWTRSPASTGLSRPTTPDWRRNETAIVEVVPVPDSGSDEGEANLEAVRGTAHSAGPDVASAGSRPPTPTSSTPSTAASR